MFVKWENFYSAIIYSFTKLPYLFVVYLHAKNGRMKHCVSLFSVPVVNINYRDKRAETLHNLRRKHFYMSDTFIDSTFLESVVERVDFLPNSESIAAFIIDTSTSDRARRKLQSYFEFDCWHQSCSYLKTM